MKKNWGRLLCASAALACLAPTCALTPVEHVFSDGTYTLTYWQVGQERAGRTQLDVYFAARLESGLGTNQVDLEATVTSGDPSISLPDGVLRFTPLAVGESAVSLDAFTIRQDRTVPFDPQNLSVSFAASPPPTPVGYAGTIGTLGGRVDRSLGDVRLDFSAGALTADTAISIVPIDEDEVGALVDVELRPDGSSFGAPVDLTLSYADVRLSDDLDENDLTIYRIEDDESLTPLPTTVDTAARTVRATLAGFSRYGVRSLSSSAPCFTSFEDFWLCYDALGLNAVIPAAPGPLDSSFGTAGWRVITTNTILDEATDLAIQNDGKIVIGGNNNHMVVWRLREDGSSDTTFSGDGEARVVVQVQSYGEALALQDDGKILLVGSANDPPPTTQDVDPVILRFDAFGELDPSFADNGVLIEQDPTAFFNVAVDTYPDGRILTLANGSVYQYLPDGTPDVGFGNAGVLDPFPAIGTFLQILGESSFRSTSGGAIYRTSDTGTELTRGTLFNHPPRTADAVVGTTIIGIQQATATEDEGLYLARFSRRTLLETDYRLRGFGEGVDLADVVTDPAGRGGRFNQAVYVAVGTTDGPNDRDIWVARFGSRVGASTQLLDFGADEEGVAVEVDAQGRIVVVGMTRPVGSSGPGSPVDVVVARLLAPDDPE